MVPLDSLIKFINELSPSGIQKPKRWHMEEFSMQLKHTIYILYYHLCLLVV